MVGIQNVASAMENSMEVHQKIKNRATKWSNNPTLGNLLKKDLKLGP
jgi:hypothetical protein